ncbi:hypothetical protein ASE00_17550 [Sphingomonas sp. Root710]|uniref:outer membrane protein n=1 Tax=Sphingomonas sp. Root710 TaxID=1736594 RepID=UPI0006F382FB|nr:outer membrane beta-barrel protein [Sphingomonas sp. Root710]KRB80821.1 hypothetical protein ASE00_17550 [Sphingomonas sp. Root710]
MKYLVGAALVMAAWATPVLASDEVTYRVEAHGGWDRVTVGGGGDEGITYGLAVGVDIPLGSVAFIGFEGSADLSTTKECFGSVAFGRFCEKAGRDLGAVVRVGVNVSKGLKLYALGGYSNARITDSFTSTIGSSKVSTNGDGYRLGAGAEIKLGKAAYTKLEYRYSNYEAGYARHQVIGGLGLAL